MKRSNLGIEAIADADNLRLAAWKTLRGKRAKQDARIYLDHLNANLADLREQLLSGEVLVGRFHQFTIFDPKERLITAPCFGERVLHHAILNVSEPIFERGLIADTFACRRGKGRIACLQRAQEFSHRFRYFLKLDIRKYFDSIDHSVLMALLSRRFKDRNLLKLFRRIIESYRVSQGRGLPIGSLTSQHFANFYLGDCDRFIKEHLHLPGYVRYMDDMAIWADSSLMLRDALPQLRTFLDTKLGLSVKPEPYFNRTPHGLDFLGCRIFPSHHVLNSRSRQRFRRKLRQLELALDKGEVGEEEAQQRAGALVAFTQTPGLKSWQFRSRTLYQKLG